VGSDLSSFPTLQGGTDARSINGAHITDCSSNDAYESTDSNSNAGTDTESRGLLLAWYHVRQVSKW